MKSSIYFIPFLVIALTGGCTTGYHQSKLQSTKEREMTVGVVQKEIRVGMSQADVAEALGSPNIVTKDNDGQETWVYDKIASEASYSNSRGGIGGGAGAVVGTVLTLGLINYSQSSGATSSTQKTLTVIIKFDEASKVKSFSYNSTKF
jgi:outer membrane protein assembly factor BamE (lipoprotein component of BamABCDE complex)